MKRLLPLLGFPMSVNPFGRGSKVDLEAEKAAIRNTDAERMKAIQAKDIARTITFFAEDAAAFPASAPLLLGREAIREMYAQLFGMPGFSPSWQPTKIEVALSGDLGYSYGAYADSMIDPNGRPFTERGKWVTVWKKQPDGAWRSVVDIANTDAPPAAPENA